MIYLANAAFYSCLTAAAILLFKFIFKNKLPAKWHVYIWALLIIRAFVPSLPESDVSIYNAVPDLSPIAEQRSGDALVSPILPQENAGGEMAASETPRRADTGKIIISVWLFGAAGLFIYFISVYLAASKKISALPDADCDVQKLFEKCRIDVGYRRSVSLKCGDNALAKGFFAPTVIIPENHDKTQLKDIMLHELSHLKGLDTIKIWFAIVFLCLNWFNPVIWLSYFVFRGDIELYCDARALKISESKRDYAALLLKTAAKKPVAALPLLGSGGSVKRRIRYMAEFKKPKIVISILMIIILSLAATIFMTNAKKEDINGFDEQEWITAIITHDTALFEDADMTKPVAPLKPHDLVCVIYKESEDVYYAQTPASEIPVAEGYVPVDHLSTDRRDFSGANYGVVNNVTVYGSENEDDIYLENYSSVIIIDEYKGDFARCSLPGGDFDKYIKVSDIGYDLTPSECDLSFTDIQRECDNGHKPYLLDAKDTAIEYLNGSGMGVEILYYTESSALAFGKGKVIELYKPVKKDKSGIWAVKGELEVGSWEEKEVPIISATLITENGRSTLNVRDDPEKLTSLQNMLNGAKRLENATKCDFSSELYLVFGDNSAVVLDPAVDSCRIFRTGGAYYEYGSDDNREFFALFNL